MLEKIMSDKDYELDDKCQEMSLKQKQIIDKYIDQLITKEAYRLNLLKIGRNGENGRENTGN